MSAMIWIAEDAPRIGRFNNAQRLRLTPYVVQMGGKGPLSSASPADYLTVVPLVASLPAGRTTKTFGSSTMNDVLQVFPSSGLQML